MIRFLPTIYPGESFYSYLSRLYSRSGFIWSQGIAREFLVRPLENPDYNFINILSNQFKEVLAKDYPFEELVLEHTLLKYYSRFIYKDKRKEVYLRAINNKPYLFRYLPIPRRTRDQYLRYCPMCVEEDRKKYGECYFHLNHQIYELTVCTNHCCRLIETSIKDNRSQVCRYEPLEMIVGEVVEPRLVREDDINSVVAKYIGELNNLELDLEQSIRIGDYLTSRLNNRYLSTRGEQKDLSQIEIDMREFYKGLEVYDITKGRLATIYRNEFINIYDIVLIALFEGITPNELAAFSGYSEPKFKSFDREVRKLYSEGHNYHQISIELNCDKEVVRQILLGTYDCERKQLAKFRCKKWDWDSIDRDCCNRFDEVVRKAIKNNPAVVVDRKFVASLFGLKDFTLRSLPQLREKIQNFKKHGKKPLN